MHKFKLLSLALGLAVLASGAEFAHAAKNKLIPEEGAVEVYVLRQPSVHKELKLTQEQIDRINKHCIAQWEKAKEAHELSESESDKKFAELTRENDKFVEQVLTKDQRKRLDEIVLQLAGLLCLSRHDVESKLGLTSDQKKRIKELQEEGRRHAEELIHATNKDQRRQKLDDLSARTRQKVNEVLTDKQEAKWKEMTGEPFHGELVFYDPADSATK
jgi:Spy/CpxP family protein refolding chaperone